MLIDDFINFMYLKQLIPEQPIHFFRDNCRPSCIDLIIVTDQPNLVLDSGVRSSLDLLVDQKFVFVLLILGFIHP